MASSISSRTFGTHPSGQSVDAWTLTGAGGLTVELLSLGGIVTGLLVPDGHGDLTDVVLGFSDLESYLQDRYYLGAIVGRVAGRIADARFAIDGETHALSRNDGANHIHGGFEGFNTKLWEATPGPTTDEEPSLRLRYTSRDGEEGYPGTVDIEVTYTVKRDNTLLIETEAATDKPTLVSLTHHSYFNLAGVESGDILNHRLQIFADQFHAANEDMLPSAQLSQVNGQPNDFRVMQRFGDRIPQMYRSHGDLYRLRASPLDELDEAPVAIVEAPHSGLRMEVRTTDTHLQLYTGLGMDEAGIGKQGQAYGKFAGLCVECQGHSADAVVRPGATQHRTTAYTFRNAQ